MKRFVVAHFSDGELKQHVVWGKYAKDAVVGVLDDAGWDITYFENYDLTWVINTVRESDESIDVIEV